MATVNVEKVKTETTYVSVFADFNEKTGTYDSTDCEFYVDGTSEDGLIRLKQYRNSTEGIHLNLLAAKALVEMLTPKKVAKKGKATKAVAKPTGKKRGRPAKDKVTS